MGDIYCIVWSLPRLFCCVVSGCNIAVAQECVTHCRLFQQHSASSAPLPASCPSNKSKLYTYSVVNENSRNHSHIHTHLRISSDIPLPFSHATCHDGLSRRAVIPPCKVTGNTSVNERPHMWLWIRKAIILKGKDKSKAIPVQPWKSPEGSRRLRLADFKKIGTWRC